MNVVYEHIPVLLDETLEALRPGDGDVFVDCTAGGGGHSLALLERAHCRVIGLDRDPAAIEAATARTAAHADRYQAVRASFSELPQVLDDLGIDRVDGILADIGVSSHQLDTPERGFSFRRPGPVDMRMDPDGPRSAADFVRAGLWPSRSLDCGCCAETEVTGTATLLVTAITRIVIF